MNAVELRSRGFDVLVEALGWVNAVRFIQEYEVSRFDYVKERDAILPEWSAQEMVDRMKDANGG
ncbi:MAG: hypothetical protein WD768_15885 [Phycisphaeraceae bacterium]